MELNDECRLCLNCNRAIINEIALLNADPTCLRLNVLTQTASGMCVICNHRDNVHRLSVKCRVDVFIERNIYIPNVYLYTEMLNKGTTR